MNGFKFENSAFVFVLSRKFVTKLYIKRYAHNVASVPLKSKFVIVEFNSVSMGIIIKKSAPTLALTPASVCPLPNSLIIPVIRFDRFLDILKIVFSLHFTPPIQNQKARRLSPRFSY